MKWYALFSQTGAELYEICQRLGRYPDLTLTNNSDYIPQVNRKGDNWPVYYEPSFIEKKIDSFKGSDLIVTLHGYLKILNCEYKNVYNGHPGDIVKYPELIGIHPQKKALQLQLPSTGAIIHKVTKDVDQGPIVKRVTYDIKKDETEESLINNLKQLSIDMWVNFMRGKLNDK